MSDTNLIALDSVEQEISSLHGFFVDWFSGNVADTDDVFRSELESRLKPPGSLIQPNGTRTMFATFATNLRQAHGTNPVFRIAIRQVHIVWQQGDHVLATYEEWQRNAKNSNPPDNARVATVLFDVGNPHGAPFTWIHIHETWLPKKLIEAGPYDF